MNKKGQTQEQLGFILIAFVAIIVGVVLFQVVAQQVGGVTSTVTTKNVSFGSAAVEGTAVYFDFRAFSGVQIYNATGDLEVPSTNYTVANNVINPTTGALSVSITPTSFLNVTNAGEGVWTVDATAQPTTYIPDSGSRAITQLIVIFFALAVMVAALEPTIRMKILEMFGR